MLFCAALNALPSPLNSRQFFSTLLLPFVMTREGPWGPPLQTRGPQGLLPWALTSSTTGQGVFTITSLGLERRPVLSTPHRVNLAGREGCHHQREVKALPTAPLFLGGGVGVALATLPWCTHCHHPGHTVCSLEPLTASWWVLSCNLLCWVYYLMESIMAIEHWFSKWGPQTSSISMTWELNSSDSNETLETGTEACAVQAFQVILMPLTC